MKTSLIVNMLIGASVCAANVLPLRAADEAPAKAAATATAADKKEEKGEPKVVKGRVVDAKGEAVAGAVVTVDNTMFYNSNIVIKSGKDGTYRTQLTQQGTYRVVASLTREYHGKKYKFDLHPEVAEDFVASDGAVRNFVWKLAGEKPDGLGHYGGTVVGYTRPGDYDVQMTDIELTLTPDGPLIDGSKGDAITRKLISTGDGWAVKDVPVGRYKITARNAPEGAKAEALQIRSRDTGKFEGSLRTDFATPNGPTMAINRIELEVKKP
jgi:hypothetical protein